MSIFGKKLKRVLSACLISALLFCAVACGGDASGGSSNDGDRVESIWSDSEVSWKEDGESVVEGTRLEITEFSSPVSPVHDDVKAYLASDGSRSVKEFVLANARRDKGNPVAISYEVKGLNGKKVESAYLKIAKTEDELENASRRSFARRSSGVAKTIEVYNLQPGENYCFKVVVALSDGSVLEKSGEVEMANGIKLIYAQETVNVRDIGGWTTESGKTIKYGMVYRGGELDGAVESNFKLNYKGVETMVKELGIKRDFDLRGSGADTNPYSVLGENVPRTYYDLVYYQGSLSGAGAAKLKKVFSDLAKPESYPAYIHCTYGVDRTGTTMAILEALLGMSETDVIKEYELSNLYFSNVDRGYGGETASFQGLLAALKSFDGETLADKTANALKSVGVTDAEIASIRSTLLV